MQRRAWVLALLLSGALSPLPAQAQEKDLLPGLEGNGRLKRDEKQPGPPLSEAKGTPNNKFQEFQ